MDECTPLGDGKLDFAEFTHYYNSHERLREVCGRGLDSSTSQLNLSRFGHTSPCPPV